ncbi:MAG: hypothetical protein Q3M30_10810 [Candidatus Electrothrix sp. Rat3]|nr:hypothetical protein [Candidatus Electrothrix rattekaaiensis]
MLGCILIHSIHRTRGELRKTDSSCRFFSSLFPDLKPESSSPTDIAEKPICGTLRRAATTS